MEVEREREIARVRDKDRHSPADLSAVPFGAATQLILLSKPQRRSIARGPVVESYSVRAFVVG